MKETIETLEQYGLTSISQPLTVFAQKEQERLQLISEQQTVSAPVEPSPDTSQTAFQKAATQPKETGLSAEYKDVATNQPKNRPIETVATPPQPEQKPNAAVQYNS
jgi:hypothetical protein